MKDNGTFEEKGYWTQQELLNKLATDEGKREVAEAIARVWWERMDLGCAEEWYIESTITGYPGLMSCSQEEWLEHAADADLLEVEVS